MDVKVLIIDLTYLISSLFFVFGIKNLSSPKTARKGNLYASIGMLMAIVITLFDRHVLTFEWIIIGIIVGSAVGSGFENTYDWNAADGWYA
jgi:NAD(P) transhydrogenase subunit beta